MYGVIGHSVKSLTTVTSYYSDVGGCPSAAPSCTTISVKYAFDPHSSASSFYPIILRASGTNHGHRFRGNYRLVFDKGSLTYLAPNNMPDEIKQILLWRD